jgi:nucleotide-binding universal stress UspA family protein
VVSSAGVSAESLITVGNPFEQILASVKTQAADLVVVGRHGESSVIHTPFGGTTQKVVGLSDVPVLVVRG